MKRGGLATVKIRISGSDYQARPPRFARKLCLDDSFTSCYLCSVSTTDVFTALLCVCMWGGGGGGGGRIMQLNPFTVVHQN